MEPQESLDKTDVSTEDSSADSSELENGPVKCPTLPSGTAGQSTGGKSAGLFPDLNTVDWYLDPRFQRYWKHYHQVMNWYQKHLETYQMLTSRLNPGSSSQGRSSKSNLFRFNPYSSRHRSATAPKPHAEQPGTFPTWTPFHPPQTGSDKQTHPKPAVYHPRETTVSLDGSSSCPEVAEAKIDTGINPEQFEMEITDEMVEFFAQSRRHKKERDDAKRLSDVDNPEDVYVDADKVHQKKTATTQAPKERPGVRRTQEMKLLYGKGAAMIHGMETAMQMTFDRNTDILQPKLWPNMPLKIVFSRQ